MELTGRHGVLKIDHNTFDDGFASFTSNISKEEARAASLNWYLNRNVKFVINYEQTKFRRGVADNAATGSRKNENVITSRLQLSF